LGLRKQEQFEADMGFSSKSSGSTELFAADFTAQLSPGETIISASVTISTVAGSSSAGSPLAASGSPIIAAGVVSTMLVAGQQGSIALVLFSATTSLGQVLQLWSDLLIVAPS
jgi:hypothetical protein